MRDRGSIFTGETFFKKFPLYPLKNLLTRVKTSKNNPSVCRLLYSFVFLWDVEGAVPYQFILFLFHFYNRAAHVSAVIAEKTVSVKAVARAELAQSLCLIKADFKEEKSVGLEP